jgi:hypothetical protein
MRFGGLFVAVLVTVATIYALNMWTTAGVAGLGKK